MVAFGSLGLRSAVARERGSGTGRFAQPERRAESRSDDRNYVETGGSIRYCYSTADGKESPNLRLNPGDLLILHLEE